MNVNDLEFALVDSYKNEEVDIPDATKGEPVLRLFKAGSKQKGDYVDFKGVFVMS
jgi:hypothetical protein